MPHEPTEVNSVPVIFFVVPVYLDRRALKWVAMKTESTSIYIYCQETPLGLVAIHVTPFQFEENWFPTEVTQFRSDWNVVHPLTKYASTIHFAIFLQ